MLPVAVMLRELASWRSAPSRLARACSLLCLYLGERDLRFGDW